MKRAQASLEMVIGLVILLVVAGVVISLVIFYISPKKIPSPGEQLTLREFETNCEAYCNDLRSNKYCTDYYSGTDWDKNGIKKEIVKVGMYEWPVCEDRVYCFLVFPCEERFGTGWNAIEKCRRMLCQTYQEKYGADYTKLNEALKDDITFSDECKITNGTLMDLGIPVEDNWYDKVFKKGCAPTAEEGGGASLSLTCVKSDTDKITCDWSGCTGGKDVTVTIGTSLCFSGTDKASGTCTVGPLVGGTYKGTLVCSTALTQSAEITIG